MFSEEDPRTQTGREETREEQSRNRGQQKGRHQGDGKATALASSSAALSLTSSLLSYLATGSQERRGARGHRPAPPIPACREEGAASETHPVGHLLPNP